MKKLMVAALATAFAGVACATDVFDYKASVKYVDFKTVNVRLAGAAQSIKVYVKQVKTTTLSGYLVTPVGCPCEYDITTATALRDPGFLVLTSPLAKKYDKNYPVKLLPANLLASWWAGIDLTNKTKATVEAQGYLFAGIGKADVPAPGSLGRYTAGSPDYCFGEADTTATRFLFGQFNMEETGTGFFLEPFLDAAGFGKAAFGDDSGVCEWGNGGVCLTSLAGSVIGGSFTCVPNGVYKTNQGFFQVIGEGWICQGWDLVDQTNDSIGTSQVLAGFDYSGADGLYNVVSGTWSIKANTKIEPAELTQAEQNLSANVTLDELALVKACGVKLYSKFLLTTFDAKSGKAGAFAATWF